MTRNAKMHFTDLIKVSVCCAVKASKDKKIQKFQKKLYFLAETVLK